MPSVEIVDPASSPENSRRQLFQILGPIIGVLLVIATISLVSIHNYRITRQGAISLSNDLLTSQQRYVTQEVNEYLAPASGSAVIAQDMLRSPVSDATPETFMLYGRSMLAHVPQVDSFYLANDQGQFWMVTRRGDHYEETHLHKDPAGAQSYQHMIVNRDGKLLFTDADHATDYDPRVRPWYMGAVKRAKQGGNDLYWTDPYPYISTHQFIITASVALTTNDGHRAVFAISISLNRLTEFLDSLQVGKSGRAVIVDMHGRVIAGRNMVDMNKPGFDPGNVHLDPQTQPVFTRALNVFRVKGAGAGLVQSKNRNYVTIASGLPFAHRHWVLLLNAPESDFADFASVARKQNVLFSLLVVGLASLLALGLVIQGRRMERLRKRIGLMRESVRAENASLLRLAGTPDLLDPAHDVPILTESLAERTGARRASIWRLLPDGKRLLCEDSFEMGRDAHSTGMEITEREHAALFDLMREGHTLDVPDASADERSKSFQQLVMRTVDAHGLVFHPLMSNHKPIGVIILEDPTQADAMEHIIAIVSSVVVLRFAHSHDHDTPESVPAAIPYHEQATRFDEGFLINPGQSPDDEVVPAGLYAQVPVMVVVFSDPHSMARGDVLQSLELITSLSVQIQKIARDAGLFSMQVISNRLVFLGGCSQEPDPGAALRLAEAAVSIREACLTSLARADIDPVFRIGMDVGPVMASLLGAEPSVFNVWGEAINVADLLADSTPDGGTIQVSEQAYLSLREYFLFRPRGMFYIPSSGITRSFILAGRR